MEEKNISVKDKIKSINVKKAIKSISVVIAFILIVFVSFFDATFDFENFNWQKWLANTAFLTGIMIFGILMGNSFGTDNQKEKTIYDDKGKLIGGLYQIKAKEYEDTRLLVECIRVYFTEFWLYFKNKKLIEKKVDYLVDNQFDIRVAKVIVNSMDKDDLVVGKLIYDETKPMEKVYVKRVKNKDIKIKKVSLEESKIIKQTLNFTLDTFGESYYLSLYDEGDYKVNEAEKGKRIAYKIKRDKRNNFILKISSSMIISIVWTAMTIKEFAEGDSKKSAWLNLISRLFALITSFVSGYSTSVINVRDEARAIENKTNILKDFKTSYDKKEFRIETYEEMLERELREEQEQKEQQTIEIGPQQIYNN